MNKDHKLESWIRKELGSVLPQVIWKNDAGTYEVFGKYRIVPKKHGYVVFSRATEIGKFSSTRSAISWCVADKHQRFNLARWIMHTDQQLDNLHNDIIVRANMIERGRRPQWREDVGTKLQSKIVRRFHLENQLDKYVKMAKYLQLQGFNNETARTSRNGTHKTSRQGF